MKGVEEEGRNAEPPIVRGMGGLFIPAWVVARIDVVELQGRLAVDLHDSLTASHGVVVHVGVEKGKAPGNERFHLVGVKLIAHADFERSGNNGDVFTAAAVVRVKAEAN